MDSAERRDELLERLGALHSVDVSPVRAGRLRSRCHAGLAAGRSRVTSDVPVQETLWWRVLGPAALAGSCALYVIALLRRASTWYAAGE